MTGLLIMGRFNIFRLIQCYLSYLLYIQFQLVSCISCSLFQSLLLFQICLFFYLLYFQSLAPLSSLFTFLHTISSLLCPTFRFIQFLFIMLSHLFSIFRFIPFTSLFFAQFSGVSYSAYKIFSPSLLHVQVYLPFLRDILPSPLSDIFNILHIMIPLICLTSIFIYSLL